MKRKGKIYVIFCLLVCILFSSTRVNATSTVYTYIYDYYSDYRESPDAFYASRLLTGNELGIGDFKDPQSIYARDNKIYICDSGNNRIVAVSINENEDYHVDFVLDTFTGDTDITTLSNPQDVFVTETGDIYICDTNNQRVLHLDSNYKLVKELKRPADETVDQSADFLPMKIVVDKSGRLITLVKNYNRGFVVYNELGDFSGYIGANEVKFNMADYLWKRIATKEQRAQMANFVPTEYNNMALDSDGFIYATTSVFKEHELLSDKAKPIRKLNSMGTDILVKNGEYPPIGDLYWGNAGGVSGPSKFIDITVFDNDTYYALDRTRGRIFAYDFQGNLLYAFGGIGNKLGYFQYPTAIDHLGRDLLILDSKTGGITFFTNTEYGKNIERALSEYKVGNYDESHRYWEKVIMQNGNYDLAYIGIGRNLLRQERYKEAMEYFELKLDDENYSKAFQLYRKEWIEENIGWIFAAFFLVTLTPVIIGTIKKMKREVEEL